MGGEKEIQKKTEGSLRNSRQNSRTSKEKMTETQDLWSNIKITEDKCKIKKMGMEEVATLGG